jgi:hypothetical protein
MPSQPPVNAFREFMPLEAEGFSGADIRHMNMHNPADLFRIGWFGPKNATWIGSKFEHIEAGMLAGSVDGGTRP